MPIGDLTKLMIFFGRVPETHLISLKSFPFIFFNDHTEAPKLDYSVATKKEDDDTSFKYSLNIKLESNDELEKRYKALEKAVRDLFWKEAKVSIDINGKEVYKSE